MRRLLIAPAAALGGLVMFLPAVDAAPTTEIASPWVEGHSSRTRLIGGHGMAGVELQMPDGWKT